MITTINLILLTFLLVVAIAALRAKDLMTAVILFGAFSFCSAALFAVMGAVDVAFTESVIGAAISTVFFVTAIYQTDRKTSD